MRASMNTEWGTFYRMCNTSSICRNLEMDSDRPGIPARLRFLGEWSNGKDSQMFTLSGAGGEDAQGA